MRYTRGDLVFITKGHRKNTIGKYSGIDTAMGSCIYYLDNSYTDENWVNFRFFRLATNIEKILYEV